MRAEREQSRDTAGQRVCACVSESRAESRAERVCVRAVQSRAEQRESRAVQGDSKAERESVSEQCSAESMSEQSRERAG